jgi:sugar phosphate permease
MTPPLASAAGNAGSLRVRQAIVIALLFGGYASLYFVRETFNDWTPVYMRDFVHLSMSDAAGLSAIFPGVGAISVLLTGWLGDRLGPNGRPQILFVGAIGAGSLYAMERRAIAGRTAAAGASA